MHIPQLETQVLCLEIELVTFSFAGQCPTNCPGLGFFLLVYHSIFLWKTSIRDIGSLQIWFIVSKWFSKLLKPYFDFVCLSKEDNTCPYLQQRDIVKLRFRVLELIYPVLLKYLKLIYFHIHTAFTIYYNFYNSKIQFLLFTSLQRCQIHVISLVYKWFYLLVSVYRNWKAVYKKLRDWTLEPD